MNCAVDEALQAKIANILDMALTFSAMGRVFERGSKPKIVERLNDAFAMFGDVRVQTDFERVHDDFCSWFPGAIRTASRKSRGRGSTKARPASYGHAAKVFDVASKVYVYYCHLPSRQIATSLLPFLHGAIDTAIMENLKERYRECEVAATDLGEIGRTEYRVLQGLIARHIEEEFSDVSLLPVQYDDIMWCRLNRTSG